jgi:hypothetical protein
MTDCLVAKHVEVKVRHRGMHVCYVRFGHLEGLLEKVTLSQQLHAVNKWPRQYLWDGFSQQKKWKNQ